MISKPRSRKETLDNALKKTKEEKETGCFRKPNATHHNSLWLTFKNPVLHIINITESRSRCFLFCGIAPEKLILRTCLHGDRVPLLEGHLL